ncbi:peptide/nickel ABC transporter, permease [Deferribacter desulfuricans SSM1]|uniref:Peptide/nickel ABC transporter, permease n=1 Tax=Deferribacter desulfuricans (strain DSM 14783 / JCM 11476 / NBRC 101012 / SSM1) TaxID=639282 RepID=D3P9X5_DEFDS|nr:ABC transporter permease [Deferribacter desulfuricans]BAI81515.1 peptide/nickel ABC transporter, permease [Deferribacter desulfuricans SSM1]
MKESLFKEYVLRFKKNKSALFGLVLVSILILLAVFAPIIAPFDPTAQDLRMRLIPPIWEEAGKWPHILGTDDFGRDLFSRIVYGARISLMIGVISVGISLFFGLIMGSVAGYYGKKVDAVIMRIVDIMFSIPAILLAIVIVSMLGPSLYNAMIAIGVVGIPSYARIVRASVLQEKEKEYVVASRINGSSDLRLIFKVILPNCMAPIIVQSTMGFASAVLEAAGLSFLGLGAQPPTPEWGAMLSDSLQYIMRAPWMITFPGLAIFMAVLGFNLVGDGLMDVLDPKQKDR